MTNEQIDFILDVEQYLTAFRKTMVMRMPAADEKKVSNFLHSFLI